MLPNHTWIEPGVSLPPGICKFDGWIGGLFAYLNSIRLSVLGDYATNFVYFLSKNGGNLCHWFSAITVYYWCRCIRVIKWFQLANYSHMQKQNILIQIVRRIENQ